MAERNDSIRTLTAVLVALKKALLVPTKKRKATHVGAARHRPKFKSEWIKKYPVKAVANDPNSFYYIQCMKKIKCDHQGVTNVKNHCSTESHKKWKSKQNLRPLFPSCFDQKLSQLLCKLYKLRY